MSLATLKEHELFDMVKGKLIPDLTPIDPASRCDGYSKELEMAVELKCRRAVYEDVLVEKTKYMFLQAFANARYIISDPSGIYSFDVKLIQPAGWYPHYMPNTTEFADNTKIIKIVGYLPKRHSINITNKLLTR